MDPFFWNKCLLSYVLLPVVAAHLESAIDHPRERSKNLYWRHRVGDSIHLHNTVYPQQQTSSDSIYTLR